MKSTVAKRTSASRKEWRARKNMRQARKLIYPPWQTQEEFIEFMRRETGGEWPAYMRRALPLPDYGT